MCIYYNRFIEKNIRKQLKIAKKQKKIAWFCNRIVIGLSQVFCRNINIYRGKKMWITTKTVDK